MQTFFLRLTKAQHNLHKTLNGRTLGLVSLVDRFYRRGLSFETLQNQSRTLTLEGLTKHLAGVELY